jgi:hypothetical protein
MKPFFLVLVLLLQAPPNTRSALPRNQFPASVSLVQLIASPESFDGKDVSVVGFLHLGFESNHLFLHREDCEVRIYRNSLWVDLDPKVKADAAKLNLHYVWLTGTFSASDKGHLSMSSGAVKGVREIMAWPPEYGHEKQ